MSTINTCTDAANRPASPSDGDTLYQIDTKQIIVYDTDTWRVFGADDAEGYDLDGTNVISASPAFHFDAGFINGVDATGNPSDGASFSFYGIEFRVIEKRVDSAPCPSPKRVLKPYVSNCLAKTTILSSDGASFCL